MFNDSFFTNLRLDYVLYFEDVIGNLSLGDNPFYEHWFDDVFSHAKELLINNRYITVITMLRNNKQSYITNLIERQYKEVLDDLLVAVCDAGDYDADEYGNVYTTDSSDCAQRYQSQLDYLSDYEAPVKYNMFLIAQNIFMSIFYEIYRFSLECSKRGIRFSDLSYKKREDNMCYVVTCHINQEVIKVHDKNWYDRLSLLYTV